tara:strand:+ start:764 stop:1012 length:249 start_codon:yes stop_codon:yes gene_type:complete
MMLFGGNVIVNVKGLICPSCGIGVKVHLIKTQKVKEVVLDTNNQRAVITELKNKTITDTEIKTAIKNAGYELGKGGIKRASE